jgi:glycerophosphoryl diester phosphodiesterase
MKKMKKKKRRIIILSIIALLMVFIWANNTSLLSESSGEMQWLAHRGLAQCFDISQVEWDTNTAAIIYEPEYPYLENTIESMQVAFDYGADCVEFDIQLTKDGRLACFHDYDLSYRTDGTGEISDYTMDEPKLLDIGYGYTADGGETYPFRGQGVGLMPSIEEVFETFPEADLLIHIKSYTVETGKVLWSYLSEMSEERLDKITVYGSKEPVEYLREQCPTLRVMTRDILIKAVLTYEAIGWTGYIPDAIRNTELHLPLKYARFLWGWPYKFVERMESVNTRVVLVDGSGEWSEGFDSLEDLEKLPEGYSGYVWTERIDKVAGNE